MKVYTWSVTIIEINISEVVFSDFNSKHYFIIEVINWFYIYFFISLHTLLRLLDEYLIHKYIFRSSTRSYRICSSNDIKTEARGMDNRIQGLYGP